MSLFTSARASAISLRLTGLAAGVAIVAGCAAPVPPAAPVAPGGGQAPAPDAVVRLLDPSGREAGRAALADTAQGLDVRVQVSGIAPGAHGFHVHANASCEPGPDPQTGQTVNFGGAGGHFDPGLSRNHGRPGEHHGSAHAGELPNIDVAADGRGALAWMHPHLTVKPGPRSVMGRALVVHAQPDDYESDPAGNSGARILCGLIEPAAPGPVAGRAILEGSNVFPEGIARDGRSGDVFTGSSSEGHIYRVKAGARAQLLQAGGSPGRQGAFGMKLDGQGRLWVAGGPGGVVSVIDPVSGATLGQTLPPKGLHVFLNDIAIAPDGAAYVTDSFHPVLWRVSTAPGAPMAMEPWLDLRGTPIRYLPNQINLNGIVVSRDGRMLLAVQLSTGQLWRIDPATRGVTQVRVEGGPLTGGDGLLLGERNQLVLLRNATNEVVQLQLSDDWSAARELRRITDPRLRYPTTAAWGEGGRLIVVNGQLDRQKSPPPVLPFDLVTIDLAR
jgi:Cu-Zn family superoxide dismutase